jgi:hypothetical protein
MANSNSVDNASTTDLAYAGPTPGALLRMPAMLKTVPQWVLFQLLEAPNASGELKLNKVPINPRTLRGASSTDPQTWASYDVCVTAGAKARDTWAQHPPTTYNKKPATYQGAGIGFVFTADDPYMLVDLDHSVDVETGAIAPWAQTILDTLQSYTQKSVSGTGLHVLMQAHLPTDDKQHGDVQMWDHERFVAMTGWQVPGTPTTLEPRQSQLTMVHAAHILMPKAAAQAQKAQARTAPPRPTTTTPPVLSEQEIVALASRARNGAKFLRLWGGDTAGYDSPSEADEALLCLLAFYTRDTAQLDALFRQSGLCDAKWEKRHSYRDKTIANALALVTEQYAPLAYAAEPAARQGRQRDTSDTPAPGRPAPAMTQTATADAQQRHNGHPTIPALLTQCAADVQPEPVQWLWWPYIALGTICMLDGDPGIGKSLLMLQLAANVSRGHPFPDQLGTPTLGAGEPANVLILTREDSLSRTIRPRLDASGADVSRVFLSASWLDADDKEQVFTLKHLPLLAAELERLHPRLVVLDPIQSFFGDIDMHRANQTRPLLDALAALAEKYNCAIVCIRHPAKPGEGIGKALHRGLGSVDIIGAARTGLFIEGYPWDETRALMAQTKSNLGPKGRTHIFSKKDGMFGWQAVTRLTAEDLAGSGRGPNPGAFLEALLWLEYRLEGGLGWSASDIEKEAEQLDISTGVLKRAKKALGVRSSKGQGKDDSWTWRLPPLSVITPPTSSSSVTSTTSTTSTPLVKSKGYSDHTPGGEEDEEDEEDEVVEEVEVDAVVTATLPCVLCNGKERWNDQGMLRCVACNPPPAEQE